MGGERKLTARQRRRRRLALRAGVFVGLMALFSCVGALWGDTLDASVAASAFVPNPTPAPTAIAPMSAQATPEDGAVWVWIPQSGSRYHGQPDCSGMASPTRVTLDEAQAQGFTPCKRCEPPS